MASTVDSVPDEKAIQAWLDDVIGSAGDGTNREISVRIVDEEEGRALNNQ